MERIYIFDTTLRDGEQSPGASMSVEQKYEVALQLARLGVDVHNDFKPLYVVSEQKKDHVIVFRGTVQPL